MKTPNRFLRDYHQLPSALSCERRLAAAVFLDYDGTLTPVMPRPEQAVLDPAMRQTLRALSQVAAVGIVSGRDKSDIQQLVDLPCLYYAGNHGLEIEGPATAAIRHEIGVDCLPILTDCLQELSPLLADIPGVWWEPKRLTITVHYRAVAPHDVPRLTQTMQNGVKKYPALRLCSGKSVLEIRPNLAWDKGRAVMWLSEKLQLDASGTGLIYLGDDLSDEDVFRQLPPQGMGILVGNHAERTYADYHLTDPEQVKIFLENLL
jgi:trehalose-phosphatase